MTLLIKLCILRFPHQILQEQPTSSLMNLSRHTIPPRKIFRPNLTLLQKCWNLPGRSRAPAKMTLLQHPNLWNLFMHMLHRPLRSTWRGNCSKRRLHTSSLRRSKTMEESCRSRPRPRMQSSLPSRCFATHTRTANFASFEVSIRHRCTTHHSLHSHFLHAQIHIHTSL